MSVCSRFLSVLIFISLICSNVFAESASEIINRAIKSSSEENSKLADVIMQIEKEAAVTESASDKRSLYTFLGTLTERAGLYDAASKWYASAAGIAAAPAKGTPALTSEQLVLSAVRASLGGGDYETAESYLPAIRSSKNSETLAFVRLYTVWAWLCRAEKQEDLVEPLALLESYASMDSMLCVRPSVYLTLWYITGKKNWSEKLIAEYTSSPEANVVSGNAEILPSPFWYFLPRDVAVLEVSEKQIEPAVSLDTSVSKADDIKIDTEKPAVEKPEITVKPADEKNDVVCYQLGFFRNRENAEKLVQRVKDAGFIPSISEEKRASGTIYFVVTVPDDGSESVGIKLKTAGFESYPVFADN